MRTDSESFSPKPDFSCGYTPLSLFRSLPHVQDRGIPSRIPFLHSDMPTCRSDKPAPGLPIAASFNEGQSRNAMNEYPDRPELPLISVVHLFSQTIFLFRHRIVELPEQRRVGYGLKQLLLSESQIHKTPQVAAEIVSRILPYRFSHEFELFIVLRD